METVTPRPKIMFDSAATWALVITIGLAAIAFIPSASIPFLYTKVSLLAIGAIVTLALFIIARLVRGNVILPPMLLLGALWFVPLAYLLSALFSGEGFSAAFFGAELESDTFGFVLVAALLGTLTALLLRRREQIRLFLKGLLAAVGVILIAQVFFVIAGQIAPQSVSAAANLFGTFSDLGMLLGFALIMSLLALRFLAPARRMRLALLVAGAIELFILALVNNFTVWILVALAALGLFIEAVMRRRNRGADEDLEGVAELAPAEEPEGGEPRPLALPLVVLVVALFFLIGGSTIGNAFAGALHASALDVRPSWSATFSIGGHTYASSPVFGTGPNSFGAEWLKFRDRSLNDTLFWSVNFSSGIGFIPTSFVTTGAAGVIAWLAFLGLLLFVGVRFLLFSAPEDPFVRFVSVASFVAALYLFVLAVFAVPGPVLLALAFVAVGLFVSSMRYGAGGREWGVAFARSPRVGFVIVFFLTLLLLASVFVVYKLVERYLADVAYTESVNALNAGDLDTAASAVARSILFAPSDRAYRVESAIGIAHMAQIASDTTLSQSEAQANFQAALSGSISDALTATELGPNEYQNWVALGNVYANVVPLGISGAYDNAKAAYDHAISLDPSDPTLSLAEAELEIANKNPSAAEAALNQAISLKHDYTQAIFLLSQLEVSEGKAKEALDAAEAAAYFAPDDPTILFQVGLLRLGTGDTDGAIAALSGATKANPQYANAHFFLAVAYAAKKDYQDAITELQTVASLGSDNAAAVAPDITALQAGKDPFPATTLSENPVSEPPPAGATAPAVTE